MSVGRRARKDVHADSAAIVLTVLLDASRTVRLEPPAVPDGTHDIDLWIPDGRRIAVEVTQIICGELVAQMRSEASWLTTTLQMDWWVELRDEHVRVKGLRDIVEAELAILEAIMPPLAVDASTTQHYAEIEPIPRRLSEIGVVNVARLPVLPAQRGVGHVLLRAGVRSFAPMEDAFPEINKAAVDNHAKLRRAQADERHLFVWIESPHPTAGTWSHGEDLPPISLQLPDGIDAVWLSPVRDGTDTVRITDRVWLFRTDGGWSYEYRYLDLWQALDGRTHLRFGPSSDPAENQAARAMQERIRRIVE